MPLSALTERQQEAWKLYSDQGLKQNEIAQQMGITRESANRLIARARQTLIAVGRELMAAGCDCRQLRSIV